LKKEPKYAIMQGRKSIPGVFDNSCILNLQLRLWDSYIALSDVRPQSKRKADVALRLPT